MKLHDINYKTVKSMTRRYNTREDCGQGQISSAILDDIREVARRVLPQDSRIVLFGSQARGDARENSDWDLLLLLQSKENWSMAFDQYAFPFVELGWRNKTEINPVIYTFNEWNMRKATPFYENVMRDGIVI